MELFAFRYTDIFGEPKAVISTLKSRIFSTIYIEMENNPSYYRAGLNYLVFATKLSHKGAESPDSEICVYCPTVQHDGLFYSKKIERNKYFDELFEEISNDRDFTLIFHNKDKQRPSALFSHIENIHNDFFKNENYNYTITKRIQVINDLTVVECYKEKDGKYVDRIITSLDILKNEISQLPSDKKLLFIMQNEEALDLFIDLL